MVRLPNKPLKSVGASDWEDFTTDHYRQLIRLAKHGYSFSFYRDIPFGSRFVLWRHDCDLSLNRSLRIACIEAEEGIHATYFVNPHCDFYNPLEKEQARLIEKILALGHDLGLHFDGAFYETATEGQLEEYVGYESRLLERFFSVMPAAVSFHNPTTFLLTCEQESYGGLTNCYSRRFKTAIPYCSDSNGYWRHSRLSDVLEQAIAPCLHVLTHPGWWQEKAMPPRERVFRCIDGRATAVMRRYDNALEAHGRNNIRDANFEFEYLKSRFGSKVEWLDYRWMQGDWPGVYVDLWRMLEARTVKFCRIWFRKQLCAPKLEIAAAFASDILRLPMHRVFAAIYKKSWLEISGTAESEYLAWQRVRSQIVSGRCVYARGKLEDGISFLVQLIRKLSEAGGGQLIGMNRFPYAGADKALGRQVAPGACIDWLREHETELQVSEEVLARFSTELEGGINVAR